MVTVWSLLLEEHNTGTEYIRHAEVITVNTRGLQTKARSESGRIVLFNPERGDSLRPERGALEEDQERSELQVDWEL